MRCRPPFGSSDSKAYFNSKICFCQFVESLKHVKMLTFANKVHYIVKVDHCVHCAMRICPTVVKSAVIPKTTGLCSPMIIITLWVSV